jgi:hypothetical protein
MVAVPLQVGASPGAVSLAMSEVVSLAGSPVSLWIGVAPLQPILGATCFALTSEPVDHAHIGREELGRPTLGLSAHCANLGLGRCFGEFAATRRLRPIPLPALRIDAGAALVAEPGPHPWIGLEELGGQRLRNTASCADLQRVHTRILLRHQREDGRQVPLAFRWRIGQSDARPDSHHHWQSCQ